MLFQPGGPISMVIDTNEQALQASLIMHSTAAMHRNGTKASPFTDQGTFVMSSTHLNSTKPSLIQI
jgi:hypothetical protein